MELTHQVLDVLLEQHRTGAMLPGSDEHEAFVVSAVEYLPALVAAARKTLPGPPLFEVLIPGFLPRGTLNSREHHMVRSRRVKREHEVVALALLAGARKFRNKPPAGEFLVSIMRHSSRLLDSDNCTGSLKGVRDAVAKFLGVNDGDRRITWRAGQVKTTRIRQGVVIRVEGAR